MTLSRNAETMLDALARDQGLRRPLRPGPDGVIPLEVGAELKIGITFSPANDSFYLMGALGPAGDDRLEALWALLVDTADLAERRTRVGLEPGSGQAVLVRDIFLAGLRYDDFAAALEIFAADLEQALVALGQDGAAGAPVRAAELDAGDMMIFRP